MCFAHRGHYHRNRSNLHGIIMDIEKLGTAKVVKSLVEAAEKMDEALRGAQTAKDEPLFGRLYRKQTEIYDMVAELIRDKPCKR